MTRPEPDAASHDGPAPGSLLTRAQGIGRRFPLALISVAILLYATGPVLVQASDVSGPVFSFWRLWIGVGLFGALAGAQVARRRLPTAVEFKWAVWAGLAFGTHQLLLFSAVKVTSVADVTLVGALSPLVTAAGAAWMFGERPGRDVLGWTVVAMAGTGLIVLGGSTGAEGDPLGMAMALANVVAFTAFFLLSKRSRDDLAVVVFLFGVMAMAALTVSAYVVVAGEAVGSAAPRDLLLAAAVAVGPGAVGHGLMTWPLAFVPATLPPVMRLAQPVVAALLAWWFLGETVTWWHLGGGTVVLLGVGAALRSEGGRELAREAHDAG